MPRRLSYSVLSMLLLAGCGRLGFDAADGGGAADTADAADTSTLDPLAVLDDEFEAEVLRPSWEIANPGRGSVDVNAGAIVLSPTETGQWFENGTGLYVWQPLSGNFVMTARVVLTDSSTPPGPPMGPGLEIASIMVRSPSSADGARNHSWVGLVAEGAVPSKESKDTIDSVSDYTIEPFPENRGLVRMCRIGSTLRTYHSPYDGGAWQLQRTFERPDLPVDVQVGVMSTENASPADIVATFEWIRFRTPTSEADCTALP